MDLDRVLLAQVACSQVALFSHPVLLALAAYSLAVVVSRGFLFGQAACSQVVLVYHFALLVPAASSLAVPVSHHYWLKVLLC